MSSATPEQSWSRPSQSSSAPVGLPGAQVSDCAPATQVSVPEAAHSPTPQLVGSPYHASSTPSSAVEPSQLLSRPSQTSAPGVPGVQVSDCAPATQVSVPEAAHSPTPQLVGSPYQASSTPSSAVEPSQLLSRPSQSSALGVPGVQVSWRAPTTQISCPAAPHSPTPQLVDLKTVV